MAQALRRLDGEKKKNRRTQGRSSSVVTGLIATRPGWPSRTTVRESSFRWRSLEVHAQIFSDLSPGYMFPILVEIRLRQWLVLHQADVASGKASRQTLLNLLAM
eukprot:g1368.t1